MPTQNISSLKLTGNAQKGAEALLKAHPDIQFTSGRRDLNDQARAMAGNVVGNRNWIKETYAVNKASQACQKWVDDHPEAKTAKEIEKGLAETFKALGNAAGAISKHLTGEAFDVQPVTKDAAAIKKTMKGLPGLKQFFEKEGGIVVWHAGF